MTARAELVLSASRDTLATSTCRSLQSRALPSASGFSSTKDAGGVLTKSPGQRTPGLDVSGIYRVIRNLQKPPGERLLAALRHGRLFGIHPGESAVRGAQPEQSPLPGGRIGRSSAPGSHVGTPISTSGSRTWVMSTGSAVREAGGICISAVSHATTGHLVDAIGDRVDVVTHLHGLGSFARKSRTALKSSWTVLRCPCFGLERILASKRAAGRRRTWQQSRRSGSTGSAGGREKQRLDA